MACSKPIIAEQQVFEKIKGYFYPNSREVTETIKDVLKELGPDLQQKVMEVINETTQSMPVKATIGINEGWFSLVIDCGLTLYAMLNAKNYTTMIAILIPFLMHRKISINLANDFVKTIQDIIGNSKDSEVEQQGFGCVLNSMSAKITSVLFSFMHLITNLSLPTKKTILSFCKDAHYLSSGLNGIKNLYGYAKSFCIHFGNWIYKFITGHNMNERFDDLENWFTEIEGLYKEIDNTIQYRSLKKKIAVLIDQGVKLQPLAYSLKMKAEFDLRMVLLRSAQSKVDQVLAKSEPKVPPALIMLFGKSGLGKSTIIREIAAEFVKEDPAISTIDERIDIMSTIDNYMYYRNVETVYYDSLDYDHFMLIYDDAFQTQDSRTSPNPEILELIRTVGRAPVLPHMASLSSKGLFALKFRLVILTSNVDKPTPLESISDKEALLRRIGDFKIEVIGTRQNPLYIRHFLDGSKSEEMTKDKLKQIFREYIVNWNNIQREVIEAEDVVMRANVQELIEMQLADLEKRDRLINLGTDPEPSTSQVVNQQINDDVEQAKELAISVPAIKSLMYRRITKYKDGLLQDCNNVVCKSVRDVYDENKDKDLYYINLCLTKKCLEFDTTMLGAAFCCCNMKDIPEVDTTPIKKVTKTISTKLKEWFGISDWNKALWWIITTVSAGAIAIAGYYLFDKVEALWTTVVSKLYYYFNKKKLSETVMKPENVNFHYTQGRWTFSFKDSFRFKHHLPFMMFAVDEMLKYNVDLPNNHDVKAIHDYLVTREGNYAIAESADHLMQYLNGNGLTQERVNYDEKKVKKNLKVSRPKHLDMAQEACSDPNFLGIRSKFERNIWHVSKQKNNDRSIRLGNIIGYRGKTMLSFGHLIPVIAKERTICITKQAKTLKISVDSLSVIPLPIDGDIPQDVYSLMQSMSVLDYVDLQKKHKKYIRDAVLLVISQLDNEVSDISSFIIKFEDIKDILESDFQMLNCSDMEKYQTSVFTPHFGTDSMDNKGDDSVFNLDSYFEYAVVSEPGACGSPIFNLDPSIPRKFCGIHVAGFSDTNKGFAVPLYKELLEVAMKKVVLQHCVQYIEATPLDYDHSFHLQEGLNYLGHMRNVIIKPLESQYIKSRLSGVLHEPRKELVKLGVWNKGNEIYDPYLDGVFKYTGVSPDTLPKINVIPGIYANICARSPKKLRNYKRVFTVEEAIYGIPRLRYFNGLNRNSSPGYGWPKFGMKGKNYWFTGQLNSELEPISINPLLYAKVMERVNGAKQNQMLETFYILTAKDEKKKDGSKARLFTNPPMDYTIAVRMYFGGFIAWFLENHIHNRSMIGMNIYSTDVDYIGRKFENYPNIIGGDFANYDGHERADVLWMVFKFIEMWYQGPDETKWNKEDMMVRYILYLDLVNSKHICWNFVYQLARSVPSGHPLTSVVNTLYNLILNVIAFIELVPDRYKSVKDYFINVYSLFFGDDHAIGVKNRIKQYFNYNGLASVYTSLGHVYTTSHKTEIVPGTPFDNLEDIVILKRILYFNFELGRYVAKLEKLSIEETLNWCKKKNNTYSMLMQNVDFVLREASLWDVDYYSEVVCKLYNEFDKHDICYEFEDHDILRRKVLTVRDTTWGDDFSHLTINKGLL